MELIDPYVASDRKEAIQKIQEKRRGMMIEPVFHPDSCQIRNHID